MHQADDQRLDEAAPWMSMGVRTGIVAGGFAGMGVGVDMPLAAMLMDMEMNAARGECEKDMRAEQDDHHADTEFQHRLDAFGDGKAEQDRGAANCKQRHGVAEPPIGAAQHELAG